MGICNGKSTEWLFVHCFQVKLEFRNVGFCGGRKTGEPGEKPSEQGTITNNKLNPSTLVWRQLRCSNPGHIDGRRALSPLRHPCSPIHISARFQTKNKQKRNNLTKLFGTERLSVAIISRLRFFLFCRLTGLFIQFWGVLL